MNQNQQSESQLELSLSGFQQNVDRLLEDPSLETAQKAYISSIGFRELADEEVNNRRVPLQEARRYTDMVGLCIREFRKMIPGLNGDGFHLDLFY